MLPFSTGATNDEYRVWVCDPLFLVRHAGHLMEVAKKLTDWFTPIAKAANPPFSHAKCVFATFRVVPRPHELLIYVVPNKCSVVKECPGASPASYATSNKLGVTVIGGATGSEIWMNEQRLNSADGIASMIFHEAMHNKLQISDSLHSKFAPCKLSCANVQWPTSPSPAESAAIAAALRKPVTQWVRGQEILFSAKALRRRDDLFWDAAITL